MEYPQTGKGPTELPDYQTKHTCDVTMHKPVHITPESQAACFPVAATQDQAGDTLMPTILL